MIIQAKPDIGSNLNHLVSTKDNVERTSVRTLPAGASLILEGVNSLVLNADFEVELSLTEPLKEPFVVNTKSIVFTNNQRSVRILAIVDTTVTLAIGYKKIEDTPPGPEPEPEPLERFDLWLIPQEADTQQFTPAVSSTAIVSLSALNYLQIRFTPDVDLPSGTKIRILNGYAYDPATAGSDGYLYVYFSNPSYTLYIAGQGSEAPVDDPIPGQFLDLVLQSNAVIPAGVLVTMVGTGSFASPSQSLLERVEMQVVITDAEGNTLVTGNKLRFTQ